MKRTTKSISTLLLAGLCILPIHCTTRAELHWNHEESHQWAAVRPGAWGETGFRRLDPSGTGIHFKNRLTKEEIDANHHYLNGSGVAAGDVDGDGWADVYFARLNGPNRLYKNLGGFQFSEVTDSARVAHDGYYSTGATFSDVDGDDDLDLLVTSMSKETALYLNDGQGHFARATDFDAKAGQGSHSMALADIDGDRDLDLYVAHYKEKPVQDIFPPSTLTWERTVREAYTRDRDSYSLVPPFDEHYTIIPNKNGLPDRRETGTVDALYLNTGNGSFQVIEDLERRFLSSDGTPQGLSSDWGLTAKFQDINRDGLPDLYVCNDFWTPDRIWINQGGGIFRALDPLAIRNASFSSMAVDFSDINRDGALDVFTTEMLSANHEGRLRQFLANDPFPTDQIDSRPKYTRNALYLNRGDDTYAEISYFSNLEATGWSWATRFLDVDLDGFEDLLVFTGFSHDLQDIDSQREMGRRMAQSPTSERFITEYPSLHLQNKAFRNNGDLTFSEQSNVWGFSEQDISHGLAMADFDRDGDLDLAVNRLDATAALFENRTAASRIAVRLSGLPPNTQAIGAHVTLRGGPVIQQDEVIAGGGYLSGSDPLIVFAAKADNPDHLLTVTWPDGKQTSIDSVHANRIYDIQEPQRVATTAPTRASTPTPPTLFADVSDRITHRHHEAPYDDFRIQPLMPVKLSQQGPGVSWIDFDADGDDDLFVASGRGGELAVYENGGNGVFTSRTLGTMTRTTPADQTTILGWTTERGTRVIVGTANYEPGDIRTPSVRHYAVRSGSVVRQDSIPGTLSTTGPLAAADYDGDGDLDLFVGGRFVPAQYPADATSRLFKNENGRFLRDEANAGQLDNLGLVTGAVFTDYDGDGDPDLLLSLEWGPLVLFQNERGSFRDVSKEVGLSPHRGWWNGVATGDFNNDGRPDIVATNWGTNSPYQLASEHPLKVYYGDFNSDRRVEIIEAYHEPAVGAYVPRRQLNAFEAASVAFISRPRTHRQFARASLNTILGENPENRLDSKAVSTLAHTLFVNEGDRFTAHPLPATAQFSASFHASVADVDNDGSEDLFLSQNLFAVRDQMPRLDAGRGLWLQGNGRGHFNILPGHVSGVTVYGEQRGAALADFNADGKVDLAVSQNGAATKLYRNQTPKPGIVVRLKGPTSNRNGIGSSIRLIYANGSKGPRREIQAGSGYWSQNSATHVLGYARKPEQIEVTWPDGRVEAVDVAEGKSTYVIAYP